jgi:UDP-N-acetylmuramoyl-tripeptide--D-alanyl-D-alanine ligase
MKEADMADLWQGSEVIAALGAHLVETSSSDWPTDWQANGVAIDTRDLAAGDIFVALPGEKVDGHNFVTRAFDLGAAAALVRADTQMPDLPEGAVLLPVDDVLAALETLGRAARARSSAYIIGVTGSVGKTTVKEALRTALGKSGAVHASEKSFNNHIGVPLTLARLSAEADYAVFELGMNHAGEIAALVDMVRPHCAIITEIGSAHIEHFASMTALAEAKAEIIGGVQQHGLAILPYDNEYYPVLAGVAENRNIRIAGFSSKDDAAATAYVSMAKLHDSCSCVTASVSGHEVTYKIGAAGAHLVANSLAVLLAAEAAGADFALAALSLAENEGLSGRGQRFQLGTQDAPIGLIDESYNANPTSMAAALKTLGLVPRLGRGRRIAVLGDMAELGDEAVAMHIALAADIEAADIDLVVTCGPLMRHLHNHLPPGRMGPHVETPREIAEILQRDMHANDVVMVKGSNASGMGEVVTKLRQAAENNEMMRVG